MPMTSATLTALTAGISTLTSLPNENAATAALAAGLHASGISSFWTAKSIHPLLGNAKVKPSWKGSKAYDLAWATTQGATQPDHFVQVKLGNKDQEDQEVLLFLGDLAFASLDYVGSSSAIACVAIIPIGRITPYWSRLEPTLGNAMTMALCPATALNGVSRGASWIDPHKGQIEPKTRSQYSKIFGAGTNAKFVGLFHRPGQVSISANVSVHTTSSYRLLIYQLAAHPAFVGPGTLQAWWP